LKLTDENSRIRIHLSEVWIPGSVPKFHGSATLIKGNDHFFKVYFFSPRKVQGASVAKSSGLSKDVKQWQKQQLEGNLALLSSSFYHLFY
jgi:hypothetical protein